MFRIAYNEYSVNTHIGKRPLILHQNDKFLHRQQRRRRTQYNICSV